MKDSYAQLCPDSQWSRDELMSSPALTRVGVRCFFVVELSLDVVGKSLAATGEVVGSRSFLFLEVCNSCRDFLFSLGAKVVFVATNLHRENL